MLRPDPWKINGIKGLHGTVTEAGLGLLIELAVKRLLVSVCATHTFFSNRGAGQVAYCYKRAHYTYTGNCIHVHILTNKHLKINLKKVLNPYTWCKEP